MKILTAVFLLVFTIAGVIDNIATVNRLKKEAEQAFKNGDYAEAVAHYQTLVDSLNVEDDNIRLNLAHSLIQAGDTISAQRNYSSLVRSEDNQVKSVAFQQMGIIASDQQKYEESLATFKEALKADPTNEEARYNYELVKELLKEQEEQQQDQQNQDQEQEDQQEQQEQDQQNQEQQQQEGEQGEQSEDNQQGQKQEQEKQQQGESEQEPQDADEQNAQQGEQQQEGEKSDEEQSASPLSERLKEMNISEEKARMILEAMRNNEMQYIQQNRRRPEKPRDRTKPDW